MGFFDGFSRAGADPDAFWLELVERVNLDRSALQAMSGDELDEVVSSAQAAYRQAICADRAGRPDVALKFYRQAFTLLPTHAEALDNYAICLFEQQKFAEAIALFEQSAVAEPSSALPLVYLVKCYEETGASRLAAGCVCYLQREWPDKSPFVDWAAAAAARPAALAPPLQEGQLWSYRCKPGHEGSKIWIRLIEPDKDGRVIVHISVVDLRVSEDRTLFMSHLPYDAEALLGGLLQPLDEEPDWGLEDDCFGEGYGHWFNAYSAGQAGVFTAPLAEVVVWVAEQVAARSSG